MTTTRQIRVDYSNAGFKDLIACGRRWREQHPSTSKAFDDEYEAAVAFLLINPEGSPRR